MPQQLISGKNLLDYIKEHDKIVLVERSSYEKLYRNTTNATNFSTKKRQYAVDPIDVLSMKITPYVGVKRIHVKFEARSEQKIYDVSIIFEGVIFEKEDTRDNLTFVASDQQKYHIQAIDLNTHNVKVQCTCLDFYYRMAYYDSKDQSLVSSRPPKPYVKKTNRPPVNPNRVPGVCKHIMACVNELRHTGIIY